MPETSLMAWRYMNFLPLLIYIQLYLADEQEHFWTTATKSDFCVVLAFTFVCVIYADMAQISSIRHLGPALASSLQPLRIGATVMGAWIALGEPPRSFVTWIGLLGIIIITTLYIRVQNRNREPKYASPGQFSPDDEISNESPTKIRSPYTSSPSPQKIGHATLENIKQSLRFF